MNRRVINITFHIIIWNALVIDWINSKVFDLYHLRSESIDLEKNIEEIGLQNQIQFVLRWVFQLLWVFQFQKDRSNHQFILK